MMRARILLLTLMTLAVLACDERTDSMTQAQLDELGTRYAAAWSSQNPESLAAFYTENGTLTVNDGEPSIGREGIAAKARGFMEGFPDMVVKMDRMKPVEGGVQFHWTWTGTNTGPGGTGRSVRISGYEEWTLNADGLIEQSLGNYDRAEYDRQMGGDSEGE